MANLAANSFLASEAGGVPAPHIIGAGLQLTAGQLIATSPASASPAATLYDFRNFNGL